MTTKERTPRPFRPERAAGLAFVVALHGAALWGLWQQRLLPDAQETMTLFVNFITPPPLKNLEETQRPSPPKPRSGDKPQPRQLAAETPVVAPTDYVAPPPPPKPAPVSEAAAPPSPKPAPIIAAAAPPPTAAAPPASVGPLSLGSELSVVCPERSAPAYPAISRRLGEEGTVLLRVELDETGAVVDAQIKESSGFARLDAAALAAVKTWRCQPAQRHGQPVRAVALQPFKFTLQGN